MCQGLCFFIELWLVASACAMIKPVYEDDPELYKEWKAPKVETDWGRYTDGSQWIGNLFAGRAEFPWLLDIRTTDDDQENWSVGNLLDHEYVLTTCRSVMTYKIVPGFLPDGSYGVKSVGYLKKDIRISFAPTYLWENYNPTFYNKIRPVPTGDDARNDAYIDSGTRLVKSFHIHPKCGKTFSFDLAVLKLTRPIKPIIPVVQYMRLFLTRVNGKITDPIMLFNYNMARQKDDRQVCYVGAYGRDWLNWKDHIAIDYKVRYRVYYEPKETCDEAVQFYGLNNDQSTPRPSSHDIGETQSIASIDKENTYCFITRAPVGTICDHDRGAPVVCDGWVFGFIVRGVRFKYCNNLVPMPFIVVRIGVASEYYENAIGVSSSVPNKNEWEWNSKSFGAQLHSPAHHLHSICIVMALCEGTAQLLPQNYNF